MKLVLVAVFALFLSLSSKAQNSQTLKYDGYYYAFSDAHNDSSWHYLRFYPDGSLIEINSVARPGKLMANFKKDVSPEMMQGNYTLNGRDLQFFVANQRTQKIVYKGTIDNDLLILRLHSFVTGLDSDITFRFVRIEDMQ